MFLQYNFLIKEVEMQESNIILYETEDGNVNIDVVLRDETIWLTQKNMAELFDCSKDNCGRLSSKF